MSETSKKDPDGTMRNTDYRHSQRIERNIFQFQVCYDLCPVLKLGETIHPIRLESELNPAGLAGKPQLSTQVQSASDRVAVILG